MRQNRIAIYGAGNFGRKCLIFSSELLDQNQLFAEQAPELFLFKKYYNANMALTQERLAAINGSTEPAVMAGMDIVMIPGDENNFKVTTKRDLERLRSQLPYCTGK